MLQSAGCGGVCVAIDTTSVLPEREPALTLIDCTFTTGVKVSGTVTGSQSVIVDGGILPSHRPLTADLVVTRLATADGTLHVAATWLSNDPIGHFNGSGTLGEKKVATLVPEA